MLMLVLAVVMVVVAVHRWPLASAAKEWRVLARALASVCLSLSLSFPLSQCVCLIGSYLCHDRLPPREHAATILQEFLANYNCALCIEHGHNN